jgi:hypothetical protein
MGRWVAGTVHGPGGEHVLRFLGLGARVGTLEQGQNGVGLSLVLHREGEPVDVLQRNRDLDLDHAEHH